MNIDPNTVNSIITVIATVLGSVVITLITFHLQARKEKKTIFRALRDEIDLNILIADKQSQVFNKNSLFYTLAYQNIQLSGELMILPKDFRQKLEEAYEMMYIYNRQLEDYNQRSQHHDQLFMPLIISDQEVFKKRAQKITGKLKKIQNDFSKVCKYCKI